MTLVISWRYVSRVTHVLLPRAATGGGGQISKTFWSGQRRGASREKSQFQTANIPHREGV